MSTLAFIARQTAAPEPFCWEVCRVEPINYQDNLGDPVLMQPWELLVPISFGHTAQSAAEMIAKLNDGLVAMKEVIADRTA